MDKLKGLIKRLFTPITIMMVPHTSRKAFNIKMPFAGILAFVAIAFIGVAYVLSIAVDTLEYHSMKERLNYYKVQFLDLKTTIFSLKKAESEFKRLFSLGSKEDVLEGLNISDTGSLDMDVLKEQIRQTMERVGEIKDYLRAQKDIYMATPKGFPVNGRITSNFSERLHPITGERDFHTGVDISTSPEDPVHVTGDGIVSFSGWSSGSGNLVVIEHGFGYSTFYAHNKRNTVRVGQTVKRGDIIAYVGSTGNTTGPHLHYEVWKNGKPVNPRQYMTAGK